MGQVTMCNDLISTPTQDTELQDAARDVMRSAYKLCATQQWKRCQHEIRSAMRQKAYTPPREVATVGSKLQR